MTGYLKNVIYLNNEMITAKQAHIIKNNVYQGQHKLAILIAQAIYCLPG